jgi:hypothetical protein
MTVSSYPRETVEFLFVTVKLAGVEVQDNVTLCVALSGSTRPAEWVEPSTLDGKIGILITGLIPGYYVVWAKVTSNPEIPVIDCGTFHVT